MLWFDSVMPPQAHVLEHLAPIWWYFLGGARTLWGGASVKEVSHWEASLSYIQASVSWATKISRQLHSPVTTTSFECKHPFRGPLSKYSQY